MKFIKTILNSDHTTYGFLSTLYTNVLYHIITFSRFCVGDFDWFCSNYLYLTQVWPLHKYNKVENKQHLELSITWHAKVLFQPKITHIQPLNWTFWWSLPQLTTNCCYRNDNHLFVAKKVVQVFHTKNEVSLRIFYVEQCFGFVCMKIEKLWHFKTKPMLLTYKKWAIGHQTLTFVSKGFISFACKTNIYLLLLNSLINDMFVLVVEDKWSFCPILLLKYQCMINDFRYY